MRKLFLTIVSVAVMAATAAVPAAAFTGGCGTLGQLIGKCGVKQAACQTAQRNASCGATGCKAQNAPAAAGCPTAQNLNLNQLLALICRK